MQYHKSVLPSGLRVLTVPMEGTNTVTVIVLCGTGSDYEAKEQGGISHFLEHMFFKGTAKRPTPDMIKHELDGMGSISNAFTSHEITGYYVKAAKTYLGQSLDLLADIYNNSALSEEEIDRERQVIIEEMHKDRDTPTLYIWWVWERLLYGDQPAGWDVIGEEDIIRRLRREDFSNYFHHQYVAENTAVVIAGNFDEQKTIKDVEKLFSGIRADAPFRKKAEYRDPDTARVSVSYKETDQTHIAIGFYGYDAHHPSRYIADTLATLLGGSWSARMWDTIRDKLGLAYTVWTSHESYSNRGQFVTYAGVDHKNVEKTISAALNEYRRIRDELVPAEEFERVKNYIRGTTLIGLEQSNAVANFIGGEEMLTGKPLTVEEVFKKIDAITPEDIRRVARDLFREEKLRLALIGPFKDAKPLEHILHI